MNLLVMNLAVDENHVTLAFGLEWIAGLAKNFTKIDVITMSKGKYTLPDNVRVWSVGLEHGYPKWLRLFRFYYLVLLVHFKTHIDACFTHMNHKFAIMYWPIKVIFRVKNVLWYAHGATPFSLKVALMASDVVVTSTPESFRIQSLKVHHIGNGIDTSTYFFQNPKKVNSLRFITVGRISPSKKVDLLIDSLITHPSLKDSEWSLTIIGAGTNQAEDRYFNNIKKKVELSEFGKKIIFTGRLDSEQIIKYYRNSDFFFNLSSTGSIDKAILESMASGCLVISSNDSFKSIAVESGFSECIIDSDIHSIQNAISMFKAMNVDYLAKVAKRQSEVAISNHSLSGLVLRLSSILKKNSSAEN